MATRKKRNAPQAKRNRVLRDEWIGAWAVHPRSPKDRAGASIARAAVKVTKSGNLVSPVAVAVIDVLGMTELLNTMSLEELVERVAQPFFDLDGPAYKVGRPDETTAAQLLKLGYRAGAATFALAVADTIILARRPQWEEGDADYAAEMAILELAQSVGRTISINSRYGIWLRSALAYGDCIISAAGCGIMLGLPVREAAHWERRQEWAGGMLAPSAVDALRRAFLKGRAIHGPDWVWRCSNFLVEYPVPLKPNPKFPPPWPLLAINWTSAFATQFSVGYEVPKLPARASSPEAQGKIQNTIAFCEAVGGSIEDSVVDFGRTQTTGE